MRRISATNQKPQLAFNNPYDGTTKLTDADPEAADASHCGDGS